MISLKASEIAQIVGGNLYGDDVTITANPVIDSQSATPGSLFFAIKGERVDGHDFVEDARSHGAVAAIVERESSGTYIRVTNTIAALGILAQEVRSRLQQLSVVGITGSQGKTTTKELLAHVLSAVSPTVAPQGNYNNEIGAPLSILQCDEKTRFCIVEMGARHKGDIAHLCSIAQPDVGVVLKVGTAHVGEFGSQAAIAETKSELISSLRSSAIAILGQYDDFTPKMASLHQGRVVTFGEKPNCEIRAADIEVREGRAHFDLVTPEGRATVGLRIVGLHQVANALAVAAIASVLGLTIEQIATGLSTAESKAKWRMEISEINSLVLINDSYNASPEAMSAALSTLVLFAQERGGESWAFLGKMHELGESSAKDHAAIGTLASDIGIDHLICVAAPEYALSMSASNATAVHHFASEEQAATMVEHMNKGDVVLVKASRSEKFEELAELISQQWEARSAEATRSTEASGN